MAEKIMYTLQEAAEYTGLSYHFWRSACLQGKVCYVRAGNRFLVHRKVIDGYLLTGESISNAVARR